jgi:hypothetical protein
VGLVAKRPSKKNPRQVGFPSQAAFLGLVLFFYFLNGQTTCCLLFVEFGDGGMPKKQGFNLFLLKNSF